MKKILKFFKSKDFMVVFGMVFGTFIYCLGIVFILDLGKFYAGGITGISQIVDNLTNNQFSGVKSIVIAALNAPLFLIAWKGVSKRFAIVSLVSVILQVVFVWLFEIIQDLGFDPFYSLKDDPLTLAILGGLITGAGCGISLKFGASTGGMDIISQYVSLKKHISFAKFSFSVDLCVILASALTADIKIATYTIIRMIIGVLVLDKIHTVYKYCKITIITDEKQRMKDALLEKFNHGITIFQATGAFSNKPRYVLETIVWSFEANEITKICKGIDPKCFITYSGINKVYGFFNQNVIA